MNRRNNFSNRNNYLNTQYFPVYYQNRNDLATQAQIPETKNYDELLKNARYLIDNSKMRKNNEDMRIHTIIKSRSPELKVTNNHPLRKDYNISPILRNNNLYNPSNEINNMDNYYQILYKNTLKEKEELKNKIKELENVIIKNEQIIKDSQIDNVNLKNRISGLINELNNVKNESIDNYSNNRVLDMMSGDFNTQRKMDIIKNIKDRIYNNDLNNIPQNQKYKFI